MTGWLHAATVDFDFDINMGYRRDGLIWDAKAQGAAFATNWNQLNLFQLGGLFHLQACDRLYVRGSGDYGFLINGHNTLQRPYDVNLDFSQFSLSGTGQESILATRINGSTWDVSLALGFSLQALHNSSHWTLSPLCGYSYYGQDFFMSNAVGTQEWLMTSLLTAPTGVFNAIEPGGTNQHETCCQWQGPWVGFDLDCGINDNWHCFGTYEYHFGWLTLHSSESFLTQAPLPAAFNETLTFVEGESWKSSGHFATGQECSLGFEYTFSSSGYTSWGDHWFVGLRGGWKHWSCHQNPAKLTINPLTPTNAEPQSVPQVEKPQATLTKVEWTSWSALLNIGYHF